MVKLKKLETKEQFENGAQIIGVESKFPGVRLNNREFSESVEGVYDEIKTTGTKLKVFKVPIKKP
jgi:uncharacterized protein (UPF0335 family)